MREALKYLKRLRSSLNTDGLFQIYKTLFGKVAHTVNMEAGLVPPLVAFSKVAKYASRVGAISLRWKNANEELEVRKTHKIFTALKLALLGLKVLFQFYQSYQHLRADDIPFFQRIHVLYTTMGISIVAFNVKVAYCDPEAMCALVNNLVRLSQRFYGTRMDQVRLNNSKGTIRALQLLKFMCTFIPLTYSLRILRQPGHDRYLTSLLPDPSKASIGLRALVGLFHMMAIGLEFFVFMFTFSFALVLVCIVVDIMQKLRLQRSIQSPSETSLRRIFVYSQEVTVLLQQFNDRYGTYMLTQEVLAIVTIVVNTTFAVVHMSSRGLVIALTLFTLLLYSYKTFGTVYEESHETMLTWKFRGTTPWFRRYTKAYRPVRIMIGKFCHADKSLTLTILTTVLDKTATMALTTHGK